MSPIIYAVFVTLKSQAVALPEHERCSFRLQLTNGLDDAKNIIESELLHGESHINMTKASAKDRGK
jgi:hypothetical protein